ncbi:MAG: hypothetical protein J5819_06325 [Eubacterium sp.]|nr:hypothetical protein [Eubacterium sp.]
MDSQRYSMEELKNQYPDKWVILDNCDWINKSTVKSGDLIEICDDEISAKRMKYRHEGRKYTYRRTSEGGYSTYVHSIGYRVEA